MDHEFFRWTWTGIAEVGIVMSVWLYLIVSNKAPSISSIREFLDMLSDRGGQILILAMFSLFFFISGMKFFYMTLNLIVNKQLDVQNAVVLMAIQFVTGTCFGGAFGAMLTTMKGNVPPAGPTTTESVTTQVVTPPHPPDAPIPPITPPSASAVPAPITPIEGDAPKL